MKKKYVQVIINKSNINIDQYFDYKVPSSLVDSIQVGQRVIVPFGMGNQKIDAFIIKIKNHCELEEGKIKDIVQILENEPLLTENQLRLAYWIKEYYLCTYIEAIRLMIPAGLNIEKKEFVTLNTKKIAEIKIKTFHPLEEDIIKYLFNRKKEISLQELKKSFPIKDFRKKVKNLEKKGYIFIRESFQTKVNDKKERYISLSGKYKNKEEYLRDIPKRAYKQKEVIHTLEHFPYNYTELRKELGFTSSTLKPLIKKNLVKITSKMVFRNPYKDKAFSNPPMPLTEEQKFIVDDFEKLSNKISQKILIHGVTGSGKTEIYLNMIKIMLHYNKQSILLVPEISLTPQMVERVIGRFGEQVSILHSGLSPGERYDQWKRIKAGDVNIVIGARSAIFAPLDRLGLIIIDEEHESTYKSSSKPRYHARAVAEKRCELENCHLVLGSATPSIESYYKGKTNEYQLYQLQRRVDNIPMPKIKLIDMREELQEGNYSILSNELREAINLNLKNKQQSILFLNRRGHSTFVSCRQCGHVETCPHCDVSLTFHHNNRTLMCHYCGYSKIAPRICPSCKSKKIKYFGAGTEKVEKVIANEFPNAKILRMDVDTTRKKGAHDRIINAFKNKEADILIGTQMIAKGLDFSDVTLVGVIIADTSLNLPDFRSAERTFQLTTQVAGRAGRGALLGRVIVQTYNPNHYSLIHAKSHDYISFYQEEIAIRKEMLYPPFKDIINILFIGEDEKQLIKEANQFYIILKNHIGTIRKDLLEDVYHPVPSPVSKIKNKYRWHMIIKTIYLIEFREILKKVYQKHLNKNSGTNIVIDIHPSSLL